MGMYLPPVDEESEGASSNQISSFNLLSEQSSSFHLASMNWGNRPSEQAICSRLKADSKSLQETTKFPKLQFKLTTRPKSFRDMQKLAFSHHNSSSNQQAPQSQQILEVVPEVP